MLDDNALKNAIKAFMDDISESKTTDVASTQLANAISAYVRSASVTPGTFSNSGGPVLGLGGLS